MNESKVWSALADIRLGMGTLFDMVLFCLPTLLCVGAGIWFGPDFIDPSKIRAGRDIEFTQRLLGGLGGVFGGLLLQLPWIAVAAWWQSLKPTPPPEFIQKRMNREAEAQDERSGGLSEVDGNDGRVTMVNE